VEKVLFIDTEVSSLETKECLQLAFSGGETEGDYFFRPSGEWEWGAIATHHILPSDVEDRPPSETATQALPDSEYVIGHNVDFDCEVLGGLPGRKRICTLAMSRSLWPEQKSHKLAALGYMVLGATESTREHITLAHDASIDVFLCKAILEEISRQRGIPKDDWEAIYQQSEQDRTPKTITFGKHAGQRLSELPSDYVRWLLKLNDLDPYLRKALTK
jgi:exodeoxyribonuclease X